MDEDGRFGRRGTGTWLSAKRRLGPEVRTSTADVANSPMVNHRLFWLFSTFDHLNGQTISTQKLSRYLLLLSRKGNQPYQYTESSACDTPSIELHMHLIARCQSWNPIPFAPGLESMRNTMKLLLNWSIDHISGFHYRMIRGLYMRKRSVLCLNDAGQSHLLHSIVFHPQWHPSLIR